MKKLLIGIGIVAVVGLVFVFPYLTSTDKETVQEQIRRASPVAGQRAGAGTPGASGTGLPDASLSTEGEAAPTFTGPTPTPISLSAQNERTGTLIILNPSDVVPEARVGISGQGFAPRERVSVSLSVPGGGASRDLGTALSDKNGGLAGASFVVSKKFTPGNYEVHATGSKSGRSAAATLKVESVGPWATPRTYSGKPGARVDISGGGFRPGEEVRVHFDSLALKPLTTLRADGYGNIALRALQVPTSADVGNHAFILFGETSGSPVRVPFSVFGFSPYVVLSSYSPQAEHDLGFAGYDFAPGERVLVYHNNTKGTPVAVVQVNEKGRFSTARGFVIPGDAVGENELIFVGEMSQATVQVAFKVAAFSPVLNLSVYAGRPGTVVSFVGVGFARNETLTAYVGAQKGRKQVASFRADASGSFKGAGSFAIPAGAPAGPLTLTVTGSVSKVPVTAEFQVLKVGAWASLDEYAGSPGTVIHFQGHDFAPGETVRVYLGDDRKQPLATAVADGKGNFETRDAFKVPQTTAEKVRFTFLGDRSGAQAEAEFTVLRPGAAGAHATASGTPGAGTPALPSGDTLTAPTDAAQGSQPSATTTPTADLQTTPTQSTSATPAAQGLPGPAGVDTAPTSGSAPAGGE